MIPLGRLNSDDRGFISIMAIWIIAFLAVITAEFSLSVRNEVKTLNEMKSSARSYYVAEAGFSMALKAIFDGELDSFYISDTSADSVAKNEDNRFAWRLNSPMPIMSMGDVYYRIWIDNESGRLNINETEDRLVKRIIAGLSQDPAKAIVISDSILDWADTDDLHRLNGAENEYYRSLKNPYLCKNRPFTSIDEVMLVRGMTREAYYTTGLGSILSVAGLYFSSDKKSDIQTYLTVEKGDVKDTIQQFLTTAGQEKFKKKKEFDYEKININAASPSMLLVLTGYNQKAVSDIIDYRKKSDFSDISKFSEIVGPEVFSNIKDHVQVIKNKFYIITVEAWMADGSGKQVISWSVYVDNRQNSRKIKILEKNINPDIYAGLEYYDFDRR